MIHYLNLFLCFASFIIIFFTWIFVFSKGTDNPINRAYLLYSGVLMIWPLIAFVQGTFPFLDSNLKLHTIFLKIQSIGWIFAGVLLLNFIYVTIDKKRDVLLYLFGASAIVSFFVFVFTDWAGMEITDKVWGLNVKFAPKFYPLLIAVSPFPAFYSLYLTAHFWITTGRMRRRMQLLFAGSSVFILVALISGILRANFFPNLMAFEAEAGAGQAIFLFLAVIRYGFMTLNIEDIARDLFSRIGSGVIVFDKNGKILQANSAAKRILVGNETCSMFDIPPLETCYPDYVFESNFHDLETKFTIKGKQICAMVSQTPFEKNREYFGKLFVIRDISDRKRTEREVKKLAVAIEQSPAMVIITNTKGEIEFVNSRFTEITGYSKEEAIGNNPRMLKSGLQSNVFYKSLWDTITSGKTWSGDAQNKKKNGELYWASTLISPLKSEGKVTHFISVSEDATEQIEMSENLKKAKRIAEDATEAKSNFLAAMSHEIRTPISGIIGITDLTLETEMNSEQRENLSMIRSSSNSLLTIINDILDNSKIDAGKIELEQIEFNLQEILKDTVDIHRFRTTEKGLYLEQSIEENLPKYFIGDPVRVQQILNNLISNAVKFTQEGGIKISVSSESDAKIKFSVADTGIGVLDDKKEVIFQSYSQSDKSTTRKYGGTGLGLTISAKLVELMGGKIWVESPTDETGGSAFHFTIELEVSKSQKKFSTKKDEVIEMIEISPMKVLLAEDNKVNQMVASALIKKLNHDVTVVNNGQEAVEKWQEGEFDLIVMDIQMPEMDGVEATKIIREKETKTGKHIPIIALTAHAMEGDKEKYLASGMNGYLSKPIKLEKLRSEIQSVLK